MPSLPAFFEEHDISSGKEIMMIISVKEYLHILADKILYCFPNLPDTLFALARSPFTVKTEDVPETVQVEFIKFISRNAWRRDSLQY